MCFQGSKNPFKNPKFLGKYCLFLFGYILTILYCGAKTTKFSIRLLTNQKVNKNKQSLIHKNSNHTSYVNCNCDCIMAFWANSTFILQISHAKTFKKWGTYTRCRNNNLIRKYSQLHFMYGSNFYESDFNFWMSDKKTSFIFVTE